MNGLSRCTLLSLAIAALAAPHPSHAAPAAAKTWKAGEVEIALSAKDFRISRGGKLVHSARQRLDAQMAEYEQSTRQAVRESDPGEELDLERATASYSETPLSVVGTIVSLDKGGAADAPMAAHGSIWESVTAYDVARPPVGKADGPGRVVTLLDFWSEEQVLKVLLADTYVKKLLPAKAKAPASLDELWEVLADAERPDDPDDMCKYDVRADEGALQAFSFHHLQKDKVAVRVLLPYGSEACRGQPKELGLLLPIPSSLADALARADGLQWGFLSGARRKVGNPSYTVSAESKEVLGDVKPRARK